HGRACFVGCVDVRTSLNQEFEHGDIGVRGGDHQRCVVEIVACVHGSTVLQQFAHGGGITRANGLEKIGGPGRRLTCQKLKGGKATDERNSKNGLHGVR